MSIVVLLPSIGCEATIEDIQTEIDCYGYCNNLASCDPDVDEEACRNECEEQLDNCMDDEVDDAQAQLDECSDAACEDIAVCTIDAGAECYLGI